MDTGVHVWVTLAAPHKNGQRKRATAIKLPLLCHFCPSHSNGGRWPRGDEQIKGRVEDNEDTTIRWLYTIETEKETENI